MTTKTAKTAILNACLCSQFEIGLTVERDGQPDFDGSGSGCTATTRREFAPGHDATLKSMLIRAGVQNLEVRRNLGGVTHSADAATMVSEFGFAHLVLAGIERGKTKLAAHVARQQEKASRPAKTPKTAPETPAPVQARIKHGRWVRDAVIDADGTATYVDGKGKPVQVKQGSYTLAA